MWHKVRVDTKGGHKICEEGKGHFLRFFFSVDFFNIFLFFYVYEGQYNLLRGTAVPQSYLLFYKY